MEGRADSNLSKLIVNGKNRADEHEDRPERPYQVNMFYQRSLSTHSYMHLSNPKLRAVFRFHRNSNIFWRHLLKVFEIS